MDDLGGSVEAPKAPPFVTITVIDGKEQLSTNLPPVARPMVLWLLERGRLIVLTQPSEQEKSSLVKPINPNGHLKGLLKRMGKALVILSLLCTSVSAEAPTYGKKQYGYKVENWQIICKRYPHLNGGIIFEDEVDALKNEGWLIPGEPFPDAVKVDQVCRELGLANG